jgi:hypothetical protein
MRKNSRLVSQFIASTELAAPGELANSSLWGIDKRDHLSDIQTMQSGQQMIGCSLSRW